MNIIRARISTKITFIYASIFSLVLLILSASTLYGIKYYFGSQAAKQLADINTIFLEKLKYSTNLSDKNIFSDIPSKQNIHIKIVDRNSKLINKSVEFNYKIKIKAPYNSIFHLEMHDKHLQCENIMIKNNKYGTIFVQIVKDMGNEYDFLKILFIFLGITDFIGIGVSVLLGYITSKKMLKPIETITNTAQEISINNLKERISVDGPEDELKSLSRTLNSMIDRLQESFEKQNQFVSDASHELRTPIAVIQGYANLLDRWGKNDEAVLEKSIKAIKSETLNMAELIEKLLFLARGDSSILKIEKSRFMLNKLISEITEEFNLLNKKYLTITNNSNAEVEVCGDYKLLKQLLRIFIDNSIKFTKEHGKLDISSVLTGNVVKLIISDSGMGIPQNEIGNIFNRFYTVDKSRSKDKSGTGLGLAIASQIVKLHNGTIDVQSAEEIGTTITVSLKIL